VSEKLSAKQRDFLQMVGVSETPTPNYPDGLPLYMGHLFMEFSFNTESERRRWVDNVEARGFIKRTGAGGCFVRLTDSGRAALAKGAV
jgi:hypothetical protein